jgi:6-phosphogluconate dehydrogenase
MATSGIEREIFIMTEADIAEVMHMPFSDLFRLCHDNRDLLRAVISLAIKNGISVGQRQACLNYNKAYKESQS